MHTYISNKHITMQLITHIVHLHIQMWLYDLMHDL